MMTRRTVQGYLDMGRIQIPPLPQNIILTDRADGTQWLLSHSDRTEPSSDGEGHIAIISNFHLTDSDYVIYGAYDEPVLKEDPRVRLIVRGGRLGYDIEELPRMVQDR